MIHFPLKFHKSLVIDRMQGKLNQTPKYIYNYIPALEAKRQKFLFVYQMSPVFRSLQSLVC